MTAAHKVVYRLDRGAFSGVVVIHTGPPWLGWYSYRWIAGDDHGGRMGCGPDEAIAELKAACLAWFAGHDLVH